MHSRRRQRPALRSEQPTAVWPRNSPGDVIRSPGLHRGRLDSVRRKCGDAKRVAALPTRLSNVADERSPGTEIGTTANAGQRLAPTTTGPFPNRQPSQAAVRPGGLACSELLGSKPTAFALLDFIGWTAISLETTERTCSLFPGIACSQRAFEPNSTRLGSRRSGRPR